MISKNIYFLYRFNLKQIKFSTRQRKAISRIFSDISETYVVFAYCVEAMVSFFSLYRRDWI